MKTPRPLSGMTFRPSADDRAAFALLRQELGERISNNALLSMGLRELLKKYGLKLPEVAKPAKKPRS